MALDELRDNDTRIQANGIELIVRKDHERYVDNTIIDYQDAYWGRGLTIRPDYYSGCC